MKPLEEMGKFKTVVVDPPWPLAGTGFIGVGPSANDLLYPTMSIQDIASMLIPTALEEHARAFLWVVHKHLADGLSMMKSWGIDYSFTMTWVKSKGQQLPNSPYFNSEFCIVGKVGSPQWLDTKSFATANMWPYEGPSTKPEGFYDLLRRVTPGPQP